MLEAPSTAGSAAPSDADFIRDNRERRDREREGERVYASGGRGSRE